MLRNLGEKCKARFPAMTLSYSMAKTAPLDDAFPETFKLKTSPIEGQSLPQKGKKRRKGKTENN